MCKPSAQQRLMLCIDRAAFAAEGVGVGLRVGEGPYRLSSILFCPLHCPCMATSPLQLLPHTHLSLRQAGPTCSSGRLGGLSWSKRSTSRQETT